MADEILTRTRYGEAFWRAQHEAWRRSELNQREYCEAEGIPLKAFGNWRAKFKAEPQLPERELLYRRGGLSHTLSHSLSHTLSHVTYPSSWSEGPVVPPARDGHRRRFSEADKCRILEEAAEPTASLAKIARRYGIARLQVHHPAASARDIGSQATARRQGLPDHLPREDMAIDIDEQVCPCCGGALHVIGETVSEMLDFVPARLRGCPAATVADGVFGSDSGWETTRQEFGAPYHDASANTSYVVVPSNRQISGSHSRSRISGARCV